MKAKSIFLCLILAVISLPTHADVWAIFGNQAAMKNYFIAEVGEVSQVDPPMNTKWENDVYQMNGRCFYFAGYMGYWGYGSKAAFILVNAQKDVKVAFFESSIGSIKVDLQPIVLVECPSGTNVTPYSDDPEEQLRILQKRQAELKKKLEQLEKQR